MGNAANGQHGGRDGRGRFAKGCPGGPGCGKRPVAGYVEALREAASPKVIADIVAKLVELALAGDVQACRAVLDRVLGRPDQAVEVRGPYEVTLTDEERADAARIIGRRWRAFEATPADAESTGVEQP